MEGDPIARVLKKQTGSETISRGVLKDALTSLGHYDSDAALVLREFDLADDGKFNIEEFSSWLCKDPGHVGHDLRGVSVHHLSVDLLHEVQRVGLSPASKVYEIEPTVIRPRGRSMRCPRDGRLGAAYVDCIHGKGNAGCSQFMLSYTWGYKVGDIVDTLVRFCNMKGLALNRSYIWLCCLCVNQHRVKELLENGMSVPFEKFQQTFKGRVKGIGKIIAMMSPWRSPFYLQRVWCDFEMFTAITEGIEVEISMPPDDVTDFRRSLEAGTGIDEMWAALIGVSIQDAQASVATDKDRILSLIRESAGFHVLNSAVSKHLQHWMVRSAAVILRDHSNNQDANPVVTIQLCQEVGKMWFVLGKFEDALNVFSDGLALCKSSGNLESQEGAELLRNIGLVHKSLGNLSTGLETLHTAKDILERLDALQTKQGAKVLRNIANIDRQRGGDLTKVFENLEMAKKALMHVGGWYSRAGAEIMRNVGDAKKQSGEYVAALQSYEAAKELHEKSCSMYTPDGAKLLAKLGHIQLQLGKCDAALESYEMAKKIHQRTGTLETPDGADLLRGIGVVQKDAGNVAAAFENFEMAKASLEKSGSLETADGANLLRNIANLYTKQGHYEIALQNLALAKGILDRLGIWDSAGASVLRNIADAHMQQGHSNTALENYEAAKSLHERTDTADTSHCASVLTKIGDLKANSGELDAALRSYLSAKGIRERTGTFQTSDGVELLNRIRSTEGALRTKTIVCCS